jgi:hypothetical protein
MATATIDVSDWPLLTRFYGLTPRELARTPRVLLDLYRKAIPEIVAEETMIAMQIADFPHLEQSARREIHDKLLSGTGIDPTPVFNPQQPKDHIALGDMGIPVVMGDGKGK